MGAILLEQILNMIRVIEEIIRRNCSKYQVDLILQGSHGPAKPGKLLEVSWNFM